MGGGGGVIAVDKLCMYTCGINLMGFCQMPLTEGIRPRNLLESRNKSEQK